MTRVETHVAPNDERRRYRRLIAVIVLCAHGRRAPAPLRAAWDNCGDGQTFIALAGAPFASAPVGAAGAHRARSPPGCFVCCALVFAIVVVGGVTRLTHSGLSITEWQPIVGTLPPLSQADWDARVREVSGDARVPAGQPRDDARGVQAHLLVGVRPSFARPR